MLAFESETLSLKTWSYKNINNNIVKPLQKKLRVRKI